MNSLRLLIVTGVGRSGTTLLQSMLNAHSSIAFTKETHFIYNYLLPVYLKGKIDFSINELTKKKLQKDQYLPRLSFPIDQLLEESQSSNLLSLYNQIHLKSSGESIIYGDKDPYLVGLIPEVMIHFQHAIVLHIIRDPRDVILSRIKSKWGQKTPLWVHLLEYKYGIGATLRKKKHLDNKRYLEIRYEDLLKTPDKILIEICSKLDIPYEQNMLNYNQQANNLVSESEQGWKQNIGKSLMKGNSNKWKSAFSSWQLLFIESTLDKELRLLFYHRSSPKNVVSRIIQFCGHFTSKLYSGWKYIKHRNR